MMTFGLDTPLLRLSPTDVWTIGDAVQGTHIFGGTGSGKTTSSAATLGKAFLRAGFGGIVLCAKPNERQRWEHYALETGRADHLVIFSPHQDERHACIWRFNFLDYEWRRTGAGAGRVENIVELLDATQAIVEGRQQLDTGDSSHWRRATQELIRNAVYILTLSQDVLTLDKLYQLIMDAPVGDQADDTHWQRHSFFWQSMNEAKERTRTPREQHNLLTAERYFLKTFASLADRTRSSVISSFSAMADMLLHDDMWDLFCRDSNIIPDVTWQDGAIIVLDMPLHEYGEAGRIAQQLFKLCWQRAVLRHDTAQHPRPVFLYVDEAQNFISAYDFLYQSQAREAHGISVYITQSVSNYYAVLGPQGREDANALLGHFQTKIFHSNDDYATNKFAAEVIGYEDSYRRSWGAGSGESGVYISTGRTEQRDYRVEPAFFSSLGKHITAEGGYSEALLFQNGRRWMASEAPYLHIAFPLHHSNIRLLAGGGIQQSAQTDLLAVNDQAGEVTVREQDERQAVERLLWVIAFLEWLLIFYEQRYRIAELIGAEQVHDMVRLETSQAAPAAFRVQPANEGTVNLLHVMQIDLTVRDTFNSSQE